MYSTQMPMQSIFEDVLQQYLSRRSCTQTLPWNGSKADLEERFTHFLTGLLIKSWEQLV